MNEGRLPLPRGPEPTLVTHALRLYRRVYVQRAVTPSARRRRRSARALLHGYLQSMTRAQLAHYYAALGNLRKE